MNKNTPRGYPKPASDPYSEGTPHGNRRAHHGRLRIHRHREAHCAGRFLGLLVHLPRLRAGVRSPRTPRTSFTPRSTPRPSNNSAALPDPLDPDDRGLPDGILLFSQPGALPAPALEELVTKRSRTRHGRGPGGDRRPVAGHQRIIRSTRRRPIILLSGSSAPLPARPPGTAAVSTAEEVMSSVPGRSEVHLQHSALTVRRRGPRCCNRWRPIAHLWMATNGQR